VFRVKDGLSCLEVWGREERGEDIVLCAMLKGRKGLHRELN
jgi:hypothetical protein